MRPSKPSFPSTLKSSRVSSGPDKTPFKHKYSSTGRGVLQPPLGDLLLELAAVELVLGEVLGELVLAVERALSLVGERAALVVLVEDAAVALLEVVLLELEVELLVLAAEVASKLETWCKRDRQKEECRPWRW